MLRVMLVEDHDMVRQGLELLIKHKSEFQVVGQAAGVQEAKQVAMRTSPDVVLLDLKLPDGSGIELCRFLKETLPDTHVLILTSYAESEDIYHALAAGASGYVLKQIDGDALMQAISRVGQGERLLDPASTSKLVEYIHKANVHQEEECLSDQDKKILILIARGKSNREIANALFLSEKTVRNYVSAMFAKLGLHNRAEAAVFASQRLDRLKASIPGWEDQ
ncbi:hypothetical protein SY88_14390 [Clostridiales bacterium PH28_bin88]|nr:hypothetical protein SY88_14390 [Clostridiales bacterium PH28_bin88]